MELAPLSDSAALLARRLPRALEPLARLAYDYWWSWQPDGDAPFRAIDEAAWQACGHNPVRLLLEAPPHVLAHAAEDPRIVDAVARLWAAREADRARPFHAGAPGSHERPIAFVCAEFALHRSLPIYSGGLGVLAGDILKEASDRAVPMVGVGLFYRRGYFHQHLDRSGWQHEHTLAESPDRLPMVRVVHPDGRPVDVKVPLRGRDIVAEVWRVQVGRIPLYLLDTDVPANDAVSRWVTAQLYVGDRDLRLMQYAVLGIGGMRALAAMGLDPAVVHLNEGHAALATLELARTAMAQGRSFADAVAETRRRVVFTTHTPIPAGNEIYDAEEVGRALGDLPYALGLPHDEVMQLASGGAWGSIGMTQLALRTCRSANGVSRRHGEVARAMWQPLYPGRAVEEVPITHVTNGVHVGTWMAPPMRALLDKYLGPGWLAADTDPARWAAIDAIPDEELWRVRGQLRAQLVGHVRVRSVAERLGRGEPIAYAEEAARSFDPYALTVGFARRIASYKRLHLLVQSAARALALLRSPHPLQVVVAGKAHPRDDGAKRLVQAIFALKNEPGAAARVTFLEDYDLSLASELVAGCDLWLNLPRPPLEASGTSGMKAMLNGSLNLSVLDGWWAEAYDGENGWAIDSRPDHDDAAQDARDADAFYRLVEQEVVPLYYARDANGLPHGWIRRIKASLRTLGPRFNAGRMVEEYVSRIYRD